MVIICGTLGSILTILQFSVDTYLPLTSFHKQFRYQSDVVLKFEFKVLLKFLPKLFITFCAFSQR